MKTILLRFRFTLYFILLSIIPLTIVEVTGDEDFEGIAGIIFIIVCLPGIFFSYFIAGIKAFQNLMDYVKGYAWPQAEPVIEVKLVKGIKKYFVEEYIILTIIPRKEKIMYLIARITSLAFVGCGIWMMINLFDWELMFGAGIFLAIFAFVVFAVARSFIINKYGADIEKIAKKRNKANKK